MRKYRWKGPAQSLTLTHEGKELEVRLLPLRTVELPSGHPLVQCWVASGELEEVSGPKAARKHKKETDNA
jgi:hypothetical protein